MGHSGKGTWICILKSCPQNSRRNSYIYKTTQMESWSVKQHLASDSWRNLNFKSPQKMMPWPEVPNSSHRLQKPQPAGRKQKLRTYRGAAQSAKSFSLSNEPACLFSHWRREVFIARAIPAPPPSLRVFEEEEYKKKQKNSHHTEAILASD